MEYANLTIRVETVTRDLLQELAAAEDRSINYYLNRIIRQHIKEQRKNENVGNETNLNGDRSAITMLGKRGQPK